MCIRQNVVFIYCVLCLFEWKHIHIYTSTYFVRFFFYWVEWTPSKCCPYALIGYISSTYNEIGIMHHLMYLIMLRTHVTYMRNAQSNQHMLPNGPFLFFFHFSCMFISNVLIDIYRNSFDLADINQHIPFNESMNILF